MGGYGALRAAFLHPERFGTCCALSAGYHFLHDFLDEIRQQGEDPRYRQRYGDLYLRGSLPRLRPRVALAAGDRNHRTGRPDSSPSAASPALPLLLGRRTRFSRIIEAAGGALDRMGYPHTFEHFPGDHSWNHFDQALAWAIDFCLG